jgi:hypothetical protein
LAAVKRVLLVLGVVSGLVLPLGSGARAADPPANALAITTLTTASVSHPATSGTTPDGGVTLSGYTVTPPLGSSFAVGSFDIALTRDATHGTLTSVGCAAGGSGTATVREAGGDALAVDAVVTLCSTPQGIAFRRASLTPYAAALLTTDVPGNVAYSGGAYTATVTNLGTEDLATGALASSNVTGGALTVSADTCAGATLAGGEACTAALAVTPTSAHMRFTLADSAAALLLGKTQRTTLVNGGTPPSAPRNLRLVASALNRAVIAWDAPLDDGGNPLHYSLLQQGFGRNAVVTGTSALVDLSQRQAVSGFTVRASSTAGTSGDSNVLDIPARSGDALVVLRPDGKEWASEVASPQAAVPTELFPGGGGLYQGSWVGNKDGRVRAESLYGNADGGDGGPAGSYFTQDGVSGLLYVRPDAQGNPAIVANYFNGADNPVPAVVRRGYTQPTSNGTWLFAVPATKNGPTGAGLLADRRDGATSYTVPGTAGATHPAASNDGRWLAYVMPKPGGGQVLRLRTATQRSTHVVASPQPLLAVTSITWSPDGSALYVYDDGAHLLLRIPVDVDGPGAAEVIGSGETAGPALVVSDRILEVYLDYPGNGYRYSPRNAGAVITCRLDGAVLPCNGNLFDPHTTPGEHNWSMTENIDGRIPLTWGHEGIAYRTQRDFTGDGKSDFAVFRPNTGQWFVRGLPSVQWGQSGDTPLTNDFNGDGKVDYAVYRSATRTWYLRGRAPVQFGGPGDIPMAADYDGDGKDDIAVFRPSTHQWFVRGRSSIQLGGPGDVPLVAHWWFGPHDGRERPAVCRPRTNTLYVLGQHGITTFTCSAVGPGSPFAYDQIPGWSDVASFAGGRIEVPPVGPVPYGAASDVPVVGDYNGSSGSEIVLFRKGSWLMRGHSTTQFGGPGDVPL